MKSLLMIMVIALIPLASGGCGRGDGDTGKTYDIKGKIVALDMEKKTVRLDHEDIPGLMKGMEMSFDVDNAKVLEGLKPGDMVHGRLNVKSGNNTITELHKR